jgi:hypothetical protein
MIGDPLAAKRRVDEALDALRAGLTPYVSQRMERAFGEKWRIRVTRAPGGDEDFTLDVSALLKTILDNWRDVFRAEPKLRKAHSFVHLALDARNEIAHFKGNIEQKAAVRFLDAIHEVLRAIDATPQEEFVLRLYGDQQTAAAPPASILAQRNTAQILAAASSPADPLRTAPDARVTIAPAVPPRTQADRIRQFVFDRYIAPARQDGRAEVTVRAGDVHRDMRLANALPAVCSALGSEKFARIAAVTLAEKTGPANGSNVYFRFALGARPRSGDPATITPARPLGTTPVTDTPVPDLDGALVLISCVKSKLPHSAPARSLYISAWFRGVRDFVESRGARWFLLSSYYGLVRPNAEIAPYEVSLNDLGVDERRAWATKVLEKLLPETAGYRRIVIFAGLHYREFLIQPLMERGLSVKIPLAHLTRGEQLAWLAQHR